MSEDKDINNSFYNDLDTNFEMATSLAEREFSHEELLNMLQNGNIPEKQIAALKFDTIENENDCKILLNNLTGCDGKIREAVAMKFFQLLNANIKIREIASKIAADTFADATIDINGNICRYIVDSSDFLKEYKQFSEKYTEKIIKYTYEALDELDKFIFRDKKYVINKQLFKLYWCLETLTNFYMFADEKVIAEILQKCASQKEYTIREKTAQISILSDKFNDISEMLKNDENYYVRAVFLNHPGFIKDISVSV